MTTRAETIARLLNQAGTHLKNGIGRPMADADSVDAAMNCVHQALLETLGPVASPAPAAEGPWVVRVGGTAGHLVGYERVDADSSFTERLSAATRIDTKAEAHERARQWSPHFWHATVLPLAEAERAEAAPKPDDAEDISATLRREEAGGVAWEASRSYEEAERLRAELAAVKAERDKLADAHRDVSAVAEEHASAWHSLVDRIRTMADDVCGMQPVIAETEALSLIESKAHALRTALYRTEVELDAARAERDAAKAERDKLTTDEAELRFALRTIASLVGGAVARGASTEMHCAVVDEVRLAMAERDRLHSEVIAQCEEALRLCSLRGKDDALLVALAALRGAP